MVNSALDVLDKSLAVLEMVFNAKARPRLIERLARATPKSLRESRKRIEHALPKAQKLYRQVSKRRKDTKIPAALTQLYDLLAQKVEDITGDLAHGDLTASTWADDMIDLLAEYYAAARMAGAGTEDLSDEALDELAHRVGVQADFLKDFEIEIQDSDEFMAGWNARAEMYAAGIKTAYWDGATEMLPLPAMPAEGTQCLDNCLCAWRIETIDAEAGDYDCYWEWESGKVDHCQTCTERHEQWYPLEIRGFEVQ